jgi:hypothetical protein
MMKKPPEEISQCFPFVLLTRQKILLGTELFLKALEIDEKIFFELSPGCDGSWL